LFVWFMDSCEHVKIPNLPLGFFFRTIVVKTNHKPV